MVAALYSLAALFVWIASVAVAQFATALLGRYFGIQVKEIGIGSGPTIFKYVGRHWTVRVAALPLGGYTTFLEDEETEKLERGDPRITWPGSGRFSDASPPARMLVTVSGPLVTILLGLLCIGVPIWCDANQLEVCPPNESAIRPCAVQGLRVRHEPADWRSQLTLFRAGVVEFFVRLVTFQSLDQWGGLISLFDTAGAVGVLSFGAWLSLVGVMLLGVGTLNLLPAPPMNGFHFVNAFGGWLTGREMPIVARTALLYVGLLAVLVFGVRLAWVDVRWLWHAYFG